MQESANPIIVDSTENAMLPDTTTEQEMVQPEESSSSSPNAFDSEADSEKKESPSNLCTIGRPDVESDDENDDQSSEVHDSKAIDNLPLKEEEIKADSLSEDTAEEPVEETKRLSDNKKKAYSAEFKRKIVEEAVVSDNVTKFAKERKLAFSTLYGWIKIYYPSFKGKRGRRPKKQASESKEKEELQKVVEDEELSDGTEKTEEKKRRTGKTKEFIKRIKQ